MEKKQKDTKINSNKKKKYQSIKRYSLGFPFHINIKIIMEESLITKLINLVKIDNNFLPNSQSLFFGLNSCLYNIQKNDNIERMLFIFYKKKSENLYDLILFRAQNNHNNHVYFINEDYQKNFIEKFKLRKLLSFVLIKNELNKDNFNQIKNLFVEYDLNNNKNKIISNGNILETVLEFKK